MLEVTTKCLDLSNPGGAPVACDVSGCNGPAGAARPDFIVVRISGGYPVQPRIPFLNLDPIPLRPSASVPFGGAS
jgi:hypothetical protein